MSIKRGDIYYADLSPVIGSEQGGLRPVLIVQNDIGNKYSPTVIAAAITSRLGKTKLPTHIDVYAEKVGLARDSVILLEQIRTIDKRRLKEKMGHLDDNIMNAVNDAITISFGLGDTQSYHENEYELNNGYETAYPAAAASTKQPSYDNPAGRREATAAASAEVSGTSVSHNNTASDSTSAGGVSPVGFSSTETAPA